MPTPSEAVRVARRARAQHHRAQSRSTRRVAVAVLVVLAFAVTVSLAAFAPGNGTAPAAPAPAKASRLLPAGPPSPQVVATIGSLRVQLPVAQSRLSAVGYHDGSEGALDLSPVGRQVNEGALARIWHSLVGGGGDGLRWYRLAGKSSSALDVGAPAGTDVYAPVDGTIVGLSPTVVDGRQHGTRVQIQPSNAPSTVLVLTRIAADPALAVGSSVTAGSTKVGVVLDYAGIERQALARYTNDAGNHVTVEVHPAATLAVP